MKYPHLQHVKATGLPFDGYEDLDLIWDHPGEPMHGIDLGCVKWFMLHGLQKAEFTDSQKKELFIKAHDCECSKSHEFYLFIWFCCKPEVICLTLMKQGLSVQHSHLTLDELQQPFTT